MNNLAASVAQQSSGPTIPSHVLAQPQQLRKLVASAGTDVAVNGADPHGDGDQREVRNPRQAQVLRSLWGDGGDLQHCLQSGSLSAFAMDVITGNFEAVGRALDAAADAGARTALLESRSSILRNTPLQLAVIGSRLCQVRGARCQRLGARIARVRRRRRPFRALTRPNAPVRAPRSPRLGR